MRFDEVSLQTVFIDEPMLGFGHGQSCDHPKDGLYLYGPASPPERADISIGVVGTAAGIATGGSDEGGVARGPAGGQLKPRWRFEGHVGTGGRAHWRAGPNGTLWRPVT